METLPSPFYHVHADPAHHRSFCLIPSGDASIIVIGGIARVVGHIKARAILLPFQHEAAIDKGIFPLPRRRQKNRGGERRAIAHRGPRWEGDIFRCRRLHPQRDFARKHLGAGAVPAIVRGIFRRKIHRDHHAVVRYVRPRGQVLLRAHRKSPQPRSSPQSALGKRLPIRHEDLLRKLHARAGIFRDALIKHSLFHGSF